ncbi:MAG: DNA primase, partial [Lentisphaeria bacterium]|nr:DNA primase [Lentisphaeria bacterium]
NATKQVYHCFGCGAGGGIVNFVKALVNTDYPGALRWLANKYNISIPEVDDTDDPNYSQRQKFREDGLRLLDEAAGFFQSNLSSPLGLHAREYLKSRGIDDETIKKYRLGYAPDSWDALMNWALDRGYSRELLTATGLALFKENAPERGRDIFRHRIMFPICDELSRVVAFSGRRFTEPAPNDHSGKYVNTSDTQFFHKGRILYGFNFARQAFKQAGWALVCEGQLDTIAYHRAGLGQAFASQGTAFTEDQARMVAKTGVKEIHLAFDGDNAGLKATIKTIKLFLSLNLKVCITTIPDGEDPDSIFKRGGASSLQQIMSVSIPAMDFAYQAFCKVHPEGTPEAKSAIVNDMLDMLAAIPDEVASYAHCQILAKNLNIPEHVVNDLLLQRKRNNLEAEQRAAQFQQDNQRTAPPIARTNDTAEQLRTVVHDLHGIESLAEHMFDLAVHFELIACQWQDLNLVEIMPQLTPVVRALNMVLAGCAAGDWQGTVEALPQDDLAGDTIVSKVLTLSPFAGETIAEDGTLSPRLEQAMQDCQRRLEQIKLERQQQLLSEQMQSSENSADLLLKAREIAQKRTNLRKHSH